MNWIVFAMMTALFAFAGATGSLNFQTSSGNLQCFVANGMRQCLGIRYALPPIGALRLKNPVEYVSNLTVSALVDGPPCLQTNPNILARAYTVFPTPSEDCLFLNVYMPLEDVEDAPVFLWELPGGVISGDAIELYWPPKIFTDAGFIFVQGNGRLNFLGFSAIEGADTNVGLEDVVLERKWVRKNIEEFGGDRENIILGGQSGGGAKGHAQMVTSTLGRGVTPSQDGVTAMIDSSSSPVNYDYIDKTRVLSASAAEALGCGNNTAFHLACLQALPSFVFEAVIVNINNSALVNAFGISYGPGTQFEDNLLNLYDEQKFDSKVVQVSVLESNEGSGFRYVVFGLANPPFPAVGVDPVNDFAIATLQGVIDRSGVFPPGTSAVLPDRSDLTFPGLAAGIVLSYGSLFKNNATILIQIAGVYESLHVIQGTKRVYLLDQAIGDGNFKCPRESITRAAMKKTKVYRGRFNHYPDFPVYTALNESTHGVSVIYQFGTVNSGVFPIATQFSAREVQFVQTYNQFYKDLARFGRPTQAASQWPRFKKNQQEQLKLQPHGGQPISNLIEVAPLPNICLFWYGLLKN